MEKWDELLDVVKEKAALMKKEEEKENTWLWILAAIGLIAAIAGIAYLIYRYLSPAKVDDFEDDFADEFSDESFEDYIAKRDSKPAESADK